MKEDKKADKVNEHNSCGNYDDVGTNTTFWLQTATFERQRQIEMRNKCVNPLAEYKDRLKRRSEMI